MSVGRTNDSELGTNRISYYGSTLEDSKKNRCQATYEDERGAIVGEVEERNEHGDQD
jgi:hypothetical protein